MSLTWVFKQIVYLSREKDLFILKAVHWFSRKWNSRSQIKTVVNFLELFFSFFRINKRDFLKSGKQNKKPTHVQGLQQALSNFTIVIHACLFKYNKNIPWKKLQEENPDLKLCIEKFVLNFGIQLKSHQKSREV